jgi:hypothetical protein
VQLGFPSIHRASRDFLIYSQKSLGSPIENRRRRRRRRRRMQRSVVVHADRYNGLWGNTASGRSGPSI